MASGAGDLAARLGSGLGALVGRGTLPSASFAVVSDGAVAAGGFGGAGPHSVFQIGSVTKAFTGLLLADLDLDGQVRLSGRATSYLPGAAPGPVTLLDIATHTAGLPRLPPGMWPYTLLRPGDPYARYPERSLARAARRSLASAPGGTRPYRYSNYGFGLLGHLIGQAAGEPYPALLERRVCVPLGLRATTFDAVPVPGYRRRPAGPWHMGALAAAGGLYSTAADLAVLLVACLDPGSTPLRAAVRAALEPRRPCRRAARSAWPGTTWCATASASSGTTA